MEEIIKAFSNTEYDVVAMLISLDNLEQHDLEKLLYFFVYKLIDKKMSESNFMVMIDHINRTKIDFSSLEYINQINELLIKGNYNTASELLILLYDIRNISNELVKFINSIVKSEGILNDKLKNIVTDNIHRIDNTEIINKLFSVISESEVYIKSFGKLAINSHPTSYNNFESNLLIDSLICTELKYNSKDIAKHFEFYYKEEILNRMILLKKYYGLYFLANININIITVNNFVEMKYNDAVNYYFDCIKKIKRNLNNHLKLYQNYIRLFEHYNDMIFNESELLNSKNLLDLDVLNLDALDYDPFNCDNLIL